MRGIRAFGLAAGAAILLLGIGADAQAQSNYPDVQRQLAVADIPGKPTSLKELAALMKADHNKLTSVVKASGMTPQ